MKKEIIPSLILSVICLILFCGIYPAIVWGIAQVSPGKGEGHVMYVAGKKYYTNVGQKFTTDKYFSSRPSAVDYNAAGSGGSNKGPSNPDYLVQVQGRIDSFMVHNPGTRLPDIPSELVTASGSGLDPDITPAAARVQVSRIAYSRGLTAVSIEQIINKHIEWPLYGMGPNKINVLLLNLSLDSLQKP